MTGEKPTRILRINKHRGEFTTTQMSAMHSHRAAGGFVSVQTKNIDRKPYIEFIDPQKDKDIL